MERSGVQRLPDQPAHHPQPDGWYYLRAIGHDGQNWSPDWSGANQWFFIDTRAPNPPSSLTPANGAVITAPSRASAVYSEPYGWAGHMYFWLLDGAGKILKEGWDDATMAGRTTANGGTATFALPALGIGAYSVYAMAYDGALSSQVGPNTFKVATEPGAPTGLQAIEGAVSALVSWTAPPTNGGPLTKINLTATDAGDGTVVQTSCSDTCPPPTARSSPV